MFYSPGHLFYMLDDALVVYEFDEDKRVQSGDARRRVDYGLCWFGSCHFHSDNTVVARNWVCPSVASSFGTSSAILSSCSVGILCKLRDFREDSVAGWVRQLL